MDQKKPTAVVRRDIIANTGPSVFGIKRMDKVLSPAGKTFIFLGVAEGIAHLESTDAAAKEPFIEVESEDMGRWQKVRA